MLSERLTAATLKRALGGGAIIAGGVALATIAAAILETSLGLADASALYLVAVVVSAMLAGSLAAVVTAVAGVLAYDLLLTEPTLSLELSNTGEWLSLLLLSFVGITVGQLVAIQRRRADEALRRRQQAQDLYAVSRALATRTSTEEVLESILRILADRADLDRAWVGFGESPGLERVIADTGDGQLPAATSYVQLRRNPAGDPTEWVHVHTGRHRPATSRTGKQRHRVAIEAGGSPVGSLWGERDRSAPPLDPGASRLLAAAADQVGQAVHQDALAAKAAEAKVARASDALKTVLVENVSHDLRIPLAAIRAEAGPLIDPSVQLDPAQVRAAAQAIDLEAARLDRLVAGLLHLGRIQGGMLQAHGEAVELREVVQRALSGLDTGAMGDEGRLRVEADLELTWVDADPLLLQQVVSNVLENAIVHTPSGTRVLVTAGLEADGTSVCLTIEDAGPGVPPEVMARLFERFFRATSRSSRRRPGSGIGLAVARGFVDAMGGRISARASELGGLAIDVRLPATVMPASLGAPST